MENTNWIRRSRMFLDKHIHLFVIYLALMKVLFGIFLILKFDIKTKPFIALLGVAIVLIGPFVVGLFMVLIHKIFVKLDKNDQNSSIPVI